ncbi:MAG: enoyl-CoA hydratase/isomerase family protein, partial [Pseudomonadota bacterium]
RINAKVARYPKPYIAIMHGFVMGGGVGISALGSHRIVTDGSQVAMPECGIGLVPDVGGSKLLADAPGHLGEYFGMTSSRMGPGDAIHAGFADTYVPAAFIEELTRQLVVTGRLDAIHDFAEVPAEGTAMRAQSGINAVFAAETPLDVIERLEGFATDWAAKALKSIRRNCPLSVACTMEMVRNARRMSRIEDALAQEYRFIWRCMEDGEFLEGIRAAVIDKDRQPRWARPRLEDISPEDVAYMLSIPPAGDLAL